MQLQLTRYTTDHFSSEFASNASLSTQMDSHFSQSLQATCVDWRQIYDEVHDMEQELYSDDLWDSVFDSDDIWDDTVMDAQRLIDHKQPMRRRFRRLRNKRFLPFRRYSNSFDNYEKSRNENPNMLNQLRKSIHINAQKELNEPQHALNAAVVQYGSWNSGKARRELKEQGYYFDWRETIDRLFTENNANQHTLCEVENDFWAYSDNRYGKNGIEPSWRKIGTYIPAQDNLPPRHIEVKSSSSTNVNHLVYDWRSGTYSLPAPSNATPKSPRVVVAVVGRDGGGIRTCRR